MIALVVVSHSRPLARAAVDLALQMVHGRAPTIEIAAGAGEADEEILGTDAAAVAHALTRAAEAAGDAGVLVLLDLGSAVLSAEMAMELAEASGVPADRIRLSAAPLVEGLVAAVVTASTGADLDACAREAERGLLAKEGHLGLAPVHRGIDDVEQPDPAHGQDGEDSDAAWQSLELSVLGEHGLHARPAARLVAAAAQVAPETVVRVSDVTSGRGPVDACSLSLVATLDAQEGHLLRVVARGPAAERVLRSIADLAAVGFGDLPDTSQVMPDPLPEPPATSTEEGVAGSGLEAAVGPVVRLREDLNELIAARASQRTESLDAQLARWRAAVHEARARLEELAARARRHLGAGEAEVFEAHAVLLGDPLLARQVRTRVDEGLDVVLAWRDTVQEVMRTFEELPDPYHAERAVDVRSVGERVLRILLDVEEPEMLKPGILVVDDLDPALAIAVDADLVEGVITLYGGSSGHGVLIAQSRGIPVLTGVGERGDVPEGTLIGFDVRSRRLEIDPDAEVVLEFQDLVTGRRLAREEALAAALSPAVTLDGCPIPVKANVSSVSIARWGAANGAEGSGLVRTEGIFTQWRTAPTVDQQVEVYEAIAQAYHPHQVVIRTWDVGGDKPLPFVRRPAEANPFLGIRGVRAFVDDPRLLQDQLEAICRVALDHPISVMFPMITTRADALWALDQLDLACGVVRESMPGRGDSFDESGRPRGMRVGLMIEVPAATLQVNQVARGFDFVSIGSNDLTQYLMAAERGNPNLLRWADPLDPAILLAIRYVADQVPEGVRVALCGGLAADPEAVGLLVGLGVQSLSSSAASVPLVKAALRKGTMQGFRALADQALACTTAVQVREVVRSSTR